MNINLLSNIKKLVNNTKPTVITLEEGNTRPINKLEYRLDLLLELSFIDYIIVFDTKDADPILQKIQFNLFFKGGDYNINSLKEKFPDSKIILSEHVEGNSSSLIIERIKKNH